MTCRWPSRAPSQNRRAARHTEVSRWQQRARLLSETSSERSGLRSRDTFRSGWVRGRRGLCAGATYLLLMW